MDKHETKEENPLDACWRPHVISEITRQSTKKEGKREERKKGVLACTISDSVAPRSLT
jgi:hypothetical protein